MALTRTFLCSWSAVIAVSVLIALPAEAQAPPGAQANLRNRVITLEGQVTALESQLTELQAALAQEVDARESADSSLQAQVNNVVPANLKELANYVSIYDGQVNDLVGPHVFFDGANYHFRNGLGGTDYMNGLGNVVIGYNSMPLQGYWPEDARIGSHNLVVGDYNVYQSYGGAVAGHSNIVSGRYSSVWGGLNNTASGDYSSVGGGTQNKATGLLASISGGENVLAESVNEVIMPPAYDSGWRDIQPGTSLTLVHNLGGDPDTYIVDVEFLDSYNSQVHNFGYGGESFISGGNLFSRGAAWYGLTQTDVEVYRHQDDFSVDQIRLRIWVAAAKDN